MTFKLDENLPERARATIRSLGYECRTVGEEGLAGATDSAVAAAAREEGLILITLDKGFGDIRAYPPGSHPGILVIRTRNQAPASISLLLGTFLADLDVLSARGAIVVLEENRVRIRRARA